MLEKVAHCKDPENYWRLHTAQIFKAGGLSQQRSLVSQQVSHSRDLWSYWRFSKAKIFNVAAGFSQLRSLRLLEV